MTGDESSWLIPLREVASGKARAGIERARAEPRSLLAAAHVRALVSVLMAAFVVAAALLRARIAGPTFDLLTLLLRTAAVAFLVRAAITVGLAVREAIRQTRGGRALAFSDEGILEVTAQGERWLRRADVLSVVVREEVPRAPSIAERPVYVVGRPRSGKLSYLALTSRYAERPEILAARLNAWLGRGASEPPRPAPPPSSEAPEARYARAAQGKPDPDDVVVPEGLGYRLRAPYAGLLGVVFAIDALRAAGPLRARVVPVALLACVLALTFIGAWLVWMGRRRATRLGMAMLLTPEELLVRGPGGVVSVPWAQLASVEVAPRLAWSPFFGSFAARTLVLLSSDGTRLALDAGFVGVPVEVLAAVIEGYRASRV